MSSTCNRVLVGLLFALTANTLISCEEIVDAEGLPYEEKLVIHSILYADSTNNVVRISRTLPVDILFDTDRANIKDATGEVSDGMTTYPLEYLGFGGQYRIKGLIPRKDAQYSLSVNWGDLHANASTVIPSGGSIDTSWVATQNFGDDFHQIDLFTRIQIPDNNSALLEFSAEGD